MNGCRNTAPRVQHDPNPVSGFTRVIRYAAPLRPFVEGRGSRVYR
jgi:hypothetical protein